MSETMIALLSAIITGLLSLAGVWISNHKNQVLISYRIDKLEETVNRHNQVADRVTALEGKLAAIQENIRDLKGRQP